MAAPTTALRIVEGSSMDKTKALSAAIAQIDRAVRQGLGDEAGQERRSMDIETVSYRLARPGHGARHRRPAARPGDRGLRAGILGQDHAGPAHRGRGPEDGRHRRLRRRRTRARPGLCPEAGRQHRRPAGVAARHGRAGAGDRRHPGALGRRGHRGDRFGRRPDAARRDRGRDGRQPARPAGAPDEPGAAQADRLDQQVASASCCSSTRSVTRSA